MLGRGDKRLVADGVERRKGLAEEFIVGEFEALLGMECRVVFVGGMEDGKAGDDGEVVRLELRSQREVGLRLGCF